MKDYRNTTIYDSYLRLHLEFYGKGGLRKIITLYDSTDDFNFHIVIFQAAPVY